MIEATLTTWLIGISVELYPVAIPDDKNAPGVVYRIESEFTPEDGRAPYGAKGYRVRVTVWHTGYKGAMDVTAEVRNALVSAHPGYLVSVEDRGDYLDGDTGIYGISLDVEITDLQSVTESAQAGIRGAVKSLLLSGTNAAANVFATRIGFANCDSLPSIGVRLQDTDVETGNSDQKRKARVEVNIKTQSSVTSENELEAIVGQVEALLHPDLNIITESRHDLSGISTQYSSVGRLHYEHRVMTFDVEYYTVIPDVALVPLNTVHADWNIDQDADPEAEDTLTIPQE
ncbi:hypothetical protein [Amphritea sp. HPY]|uniref:hypothetical protein n=1 Tax=Amphritea sp. HPY TaxID=3421652 RepID=UPI003D7E29C2